MIPIRIKTEAGAKMPEYKTDGSAGADVFSFLKEDIVLKPGDIKLIPTGLYLQIPEGYEAQIRPRSGLALKNGITLLNTPGTIDSDYRGELGIITANFGNNDFVITNHMRIAQMVFSKIYKGMFLISSDLDNTSRGNGGFGHTGI